MAYILREHWGQVFGAGNVDTELLDLWLKEVFPDGGNGRVAQGLPCKRSRLWRLRRDDIAEAIKSASKSMPGPDGVPYQAWRALGPIGVELLFEAAEALESTDCGRLLQEAESVPDELGHSFNLGLLCCLPQKKPTGLDPILGEFYAPANTRPLAIVNTDNRLIASACRFRWEAIFNKWVSGSQRGFLHGRSMLANIVDIDFEAMRVSLTQKHGALVLFDFQAAFPSVSHEYITRVLRHLGLPDHVMRLIEALCGNTRCIISCQGGRYDGFPIRSGRRQGCPLSPLLFAVVADLLLRKLTAQFPEDTIRAFADDTAVIIQYWWQSADQMREIFAEFARISGLELNLPKTVIVPLWLTSLQDLRSAIERTLHGWGGVNVADYGIYLGFAEGPGKRHHTWEKAVQKYKDRAELWGKQGTGLFYATTAYNTYVITVLSFIGQLENPPEAVLEAEKSALRRIASGPGNWILPSDLQHLSECYGQAMSFNGIETSAWSAQVRTALLEDKKMEGLDWLGVGWRQNLVFKKSTTPKT